MTLKKTKLLKRDRETKRLYQDFLRYKDQVEECDDLISELSIEDQEFFNRYVDDDNYWREQDEL